MILLWLQLHTCTDSSRRESSPELALERYSGVGDAPSSRDIHLIKQQRHQQWRGKLTDSNDEMATSIQQIQTIDGEPAYAVTRAQRRKAKQGESKDFIM